MAVFRNALKGLWRSTEWSYKKKAATLHLKMEYNHHGYIATDHPSNTHVKFSKQAWTKREDSLKKAMTIKMVSKIFLFKL